MREVKHHNSKLYEIKKTDFLKELWKLCQQKRIKISIIGGYGLDGLLGQVTCEHNDLDLVVLDKDVNKLIQLIKANFRCREAKTSNKRVHVIRSKEITVEIIAFELFSLDEKYTFTINEIFPRRLYGSIDYLKFRTPSAQVHRKIGNMYIDYSLRLGKEVDLDKIKRREMILKQIKNH